MKGGEIIGSGGFGCVFKPSLKCKNQKYKINKSRSFYPFLTEKINKKDIYLSKLMTKKYALDEYNLLNNIKQKLIKINNYNNYFLLDDYYLCQPDKLTKKDLKDFDEKCSALTKKNINSKNINKNLDNLLILNNIYGGLNIWDLLNNYELTDTLFIKVNNSLIDLLKNGIIPMNKLNIYHGDIKDANILVDIDEENNLYSRLIDWGLSFETRKKTNKIENKNNKTNLIQIVQEIPNNMLNRPFQFNVPFSSIIFNKLFINSLNEFLKKYPKPNYFQIREFVINFIYIWNNVRGSGHLNTINNIFKYLTYNDILNKKENIKNHFIEYDITYYYIIEYISKIIDYYYVQNKLNILDYLYEKYLKILDIWGFLSSYLIFYEYFNNNFNKLNKQQILFIEKIKEILINYLYNNPLGEIKINILINDLKELNNLFQSFEELEKEKEKEKNKNNQKYNVKNL